LAALACVVGCIRLGWGLRELPPAPDITERSTRFLGEADAGLFFEVWAQTYAPAGLASPEGLWLEPERETVLLWEHTGALKRLEREDAVLVAVAAGAGRVFWVEEPHTDAGPARALVVEEVGRGELFRGPLPCGAGEHALPEDDLGALPTVHVSVDGTVAACGGALLHVAARKWTEVGAPIQTLVGHEGSALLSVEGAEGQVRFLHVERPGARPRVLDLDVFTVWFQDGRHMALDLGGAVAAVDLRTGQVLARRDLSEHEALPSSETDLATAQGLTVRMAPGDGGAETTCTLARWTLPGLRRTELLTRPCASEAEFAPSLHPTGQGLYEVRWTEDHHAEARALVRPGSTGKPPTEQFSGGRTACLPEACVTVDAEEALVTADPVRLTPVPLPRGLPATWVRGADAHPLREGLLLHQGACGVAAMWRRGESLRTVTLLDGEDACGPAPDGGTLDPRQGAVRH
jgi:hypothetical protein